MEGSDPERRSFPVDVALVIALAPLVAAALRIWMYAGGDNALFLVLLQTLDVGAVLIGTAVLLIPTLMIILVFVLATDGKARSVISAWLRRHLGVLQIVVPVVLVVIGYTVDWQSLLGFVAMVGLAIAYYFTVRWIERRRRNVDVARRRPGPDSIAAIISVVAVFLVLPGHMWVSLERISIQGRSAEVGYVLESSGEWTTVLTRDRTIDILATPDIRSRDICRVPKGTTIAMLLQQAVPTGADCSE